MDLTFSFAAPSTQPGSDDVTTIKIWESTDAIAFTLVKTDSLSPSDTTYTYTDGYVDRFYRLTFVDDDGLESPYSDTMYGTALISNTTLTSIDTVNTQLAELLALINARPTRREMTSAVDAYGDMLNELAAQVNTLKNNVETLQRSVTSLGQTFANWVENPPCPQ